MIELAATENVNALFLCLFKFGRLLGRKAGEENLSKFFFDWFRVCVYPILAVRIGHRFTQKCYKQMQQSNTQLKMQKHWFQ